MSALVSVIIPCYMQGHFLPECVASLQRQTYIHWQAIIVDDGSPDSTQEIASALASADSRVLVVRQKNGGLSSARNFGLRYALGDYIQFLDADDLLLPTKFEAHFNNSAVLAPKAVTYTGYFNCDYDNVVLGAESERLSCEFIMPRPLLDFSARWEHHFSIPIHSALFPRCLLQELAGPFDESLRDHEDWDMWMRLGSLGVEFAYIPEELAVYRHGTHSMSSDGSRMWSGFNLAIRKQLERVRYDREVRCCLRFLSRVNTCRRSSGPMKWVYRAIVLGSSCVLPKDVRKILSPKIYSSDFLKRLVYRESTVHKSSRDE